MIKHNNKLSDVSCYHEAGVNNFLEIPLTCWFYKPPSQFPWSHNFGIAFGPARWSWLCTKLGVVYLTSHWLNYWRVPWLCADARQVVWCQDWRLKAIVVQYWPTGCVVWSHTTRLLNPCLIIPETVLCYYLSLSTLPTIRTTLDSTFCGVLGDMKELHLVGTWHTSSVVSVIN